MKKENSKFEKKKLLPVEPAQGDLNSTQIMFRFPDGENAERRFSRKDKIADLYNYIETLEGESIVWNHQDKFDLVQVYPPSVYSDKDKTLEELKLYPNAVIQIRERD